LPQKNWGKNVREALARSDRDFLMSDEVDEDPSRFLGALKLVLNHPIEVAGSLAMAGVIVAILFNALAFQSGLHPAPFFAQQWRQPPAVPGTRALGQAKPAPADQSGDDTTAALTEQAALVRDLQLELAELSLYDGTADGVLGPKTTAAIRGYQERAGLFQDGRATAELLARIRSAPLPVIRASAPASQPAHTDAIAALIEATSSVVQPDKRILRVERALNKLAYGPLKVDGISDQDTRTAIGQFEMDRSMPVTGKVSARLERELSTVLGSPLE
jgi:peptidoglycan hydrolase-like protein with peptidoglycan-binding domain